MCRHRCGSSCRLKYMNVKWVSVSLSWCGLSVQFALWTQSSAREDERLHEDVSDHWNIWKHLETSGDIWRHEDSCERAESVSVTSTGNLIKAKRSLHSKQKQLVPTDRLVLDSSSCSEDWASQRLWSGVRMFQSSRSEAWQHKRLHVSKHQQEMSGSESELRITRRLLSLHAHHFHSIQQSHEESSVLGAAEITAYTDRRLQRPECKASTRMMRSDEAYNSSSLLLAPTQQLLWRGRGESSGKVHFTSSTSDCDDHVDSSSHFTRRR